MRILHVDRLKPITVQYEKAAREFVEKCNKETLHEIVIEWAAKTEAINQEDPYTILKELERVTTIIRYAMTKELRDFPDREAVGYADIVNRATNILVKLFVQKLPKLTPEVLITNSIMFFHTACFKACGQRVYTISPGLTQELRHTEIRGLDTAELNLPMKAFYVEMPLNSGLEIYNSDSGWHRLEGFYVTLDETPDIKNIGAPRWRFFLVGETKPRELPIGVTDDNDAIAHYWIDIIPGSLEDAIEYAHNTFTTTDPSFEKFMKSRWEEIFRFAVNVILYITMPDAELDTIIHDPEARALFNRWHKLPKGKKKAKLKGRLKKLDTRKRTVLGKTVVFDRRFRDVANEHRGTGSPLRLRFIRTGHFRMQAYGVGRLERRRIWIKPHWVGGKDLPLAQRTVKVQLPEESNEKV